MLPKAKRLGTDRFREIIKEGKTARTEVVYIKFLSKNTKNKDSEEPRFAVSVPKKLVKSAVKRHLIKRRMMVALGYNYDRFPKGGDYILFVTEKIMGAHGNVLDSIIKNVAKKIIIE